VKVGVVTFPGSLDDVDALQVVVAVPQRHGLVPAEAYGALGVGIVERAREGDDPDLHATDSPTWTA
jgi:hypothetical protein